MRKGIWSAATAVVLLSVGSLAGGYPWAGAAPGSVSMVEGPGDPTTDWKFDPSDVTVTAGSTVTWHNNGKQAHTVTADDGSFNSSYISPGSDFQHAFPTAGNFAYHCEPHPWMKAVVHVTGGSTATTAPPVTTTQPNTATTATTVPAAGATTTTTAKPGASSTTTTTVAGAAGATTTTTAAAAGGTTATTAAAPTPTAATDTASTTTTTAAGAGGGESAAGTHRKTDSGKTNGPLVALAAVLTVTLVGITGKLLASKSRPH